jgi:hypothetical protein
VPTRKRIIGETAEPVEIDALVERFVFDRFGRNAGWRADQSTRFAKRRERAKVEQLARVVVSHAHVARTEIAVHEAARV